MKTFLEFILESDFRSRLIPAIRNIGVPKTDKKHILKGKRGWTHQETAEHHGIGPENRIKGELGYWDTGKHEFHPKHNSSYDDKEGINLDSTELDPRAGSVALMRRLEEGNPLSRMRSLEKKGHHFIAISTERPGLSKKEVLARNQKLVSMAREAGLGVRKAEGRYEGGKESSHIIHAKKPGRESGAELVAFGRKAGKHFDQDSVLHHNGKTARLIGTNTTGFPGMDKSEKVGGKLKYNSPESPFQTELRPSKKRSPARFTTE